MKKVALAIALCCALATPAVAKDVAPLFTDEEAQVLINLIDIAVKERGLAAAASGAYLAGKITAARVAAKEAPAAAPDIKKK